MQPRKEPCLGGPQVPSSNASDTSREVWF